MKRILLIAVCLAAMAITVQAQPNPHYADMYESGKQIGKQWFSDGNARLERLKDDGTSTIMIYRADSAKIYTIIPERKVYMILPMAQATNMNALIGAKVEEGRNITRELVGMEEVDGKMCAHYSITATTILVNGMTETVTYSQWWWEPLNTFIREKYGFSPAWELRNIVQRVQPAHLFEIPKDYTAMVIPAGGFMDMLTGSSGKSEAELKQAHDEANSKAKSETDKLNEIKNDQNQTEQQKIQNALKMLEGLNKKK